MTGAGKSLVALLLTTALAGCVAGPDYHVPDRAVATTPAANQPFVGSKEPSVSDKPLPERWWELYGDTRLDGYVAEALAANTDLRVADANLRRASAVVREAQAGRLVQTGVSGDALASHVGGYNANVGSAATYSLGLNLSYPLDLAGGIRRGIEAANAQSEATQAARDQVRVVVVAAVARSYAAACSANLTLAATKHVVDLQRQTLDATVRLARGGRGTQFDVDRARTAASRSAAAIPAIIADRQTSLFELAALMGRVPADYPKEVESCVAPPTIGHPLPIGDGAALIRRRPDIRAAERTLAAATALVGVRTAELYPQVTLGGSIGVAGAVRNILSPSSIGGGLGPLISWSFPNRTAARARIEEANANADAAFASFDGTVLQALKQTETALSAYAREIDRNRALAQTRNSAAAASAGANRLFRFGRTPFLDVLTAQSAYAEAEADLAASRAQLVDRQIDLFLALGGGWQ